MESPLNKKIQRSLERSAAKKKKDSNYIPVLTLRQQVLSLVTEANKSAQPERQVTPRAALIVMDRALATLSVVDEESRDFAVLREVSSFISTAQKTSVMTASAHTDLLPQGHPLSALNASLTPEEYRFKYAQWLSADADVSSAARPLVAAAFSAQPGSLERDHAFMRLRVTTENVPGYFKLDPAPIIAAFSDGNSSAARRARVALQWRDKKGRWVEMGRGANFRFRLPGGGVASASGVYVGVKTPRAGENPRPAGLIQVSGDANLPDGIYAAQPSNVETYSARIPTEALKKAGITPGATPDQSMVGIPSQADILATRQDAPEGWTKQDDNTFTSDDNYTAKINDGEYTLWRQNEDGSLGSKVGDAANWADINDLANNDQEAYDQVKDQSQPSQAKEEVKARIENRTKQNELFDKLQAIADQGGIDEFGNPLPAGWKAVVRPAPLRQVQERRLGNDIVLNEEGAPSLGYEGPLGNEIDDQGNVVRPFMAGGGTWPTEENPKRVVVNGEPYDSWQDFESQIPDIIARMNEEPLRKYGREYKLAPVSTTQEPSSKDIFERRMAGESLDKVAKDLGLTREEVRRIEAKYARQNPNAVERARNKQNVDGHKTPSQVSVELDKIFANVPKVDYNAWAEDQNNSGNNSLEYPNLPEGTLLLTSGEYNNIVKYPDGTYAVGMGEGAEDPKNPGTQVFTPLSELDSSPDYTIYDANENEISATLPEVVLWSVGPDANPDFGGLTDFIVTRKDIPFNYEAAKKIALDSSKPAQERYAAVFDGAAGRDFFEYVANSGIERSELDPSIPEGTEVVFADGDGQNLTLRYPDGTYHYLDTGLFDENDLIPVDPVSAYDGDGINDAVLKDLLDINSLAYARGAFMDSARQDLIAKGSSGDGDDEPPTPPSGPGGTPPSGPDDNQPFDMAVAQRFIDERFAKSGIDLVGTTREGRNSYMILSIPEDKLEDFKLDSGFDNFEDEDFFAKLPNGTYKLYTDFSELNANLDNPIDPQDEPPTPPSGPGGTPPKTPSPSTPSAPGLFKEFDVPNGAFELRGVDYEPEGRVDEKSSDFTDDPEKLATKFSVQDLIAAFSEAILGNSSDASIAEILNTNVGDDNELDAPSEVDVNVDMPQVALGSPSGAGRLEFNAGEEFILAESLFNALWHAGVDPNRVLANLYDSVNGDNKNLSKLIEAQGGTPSPEEAQLVDDITAEIRQIKDATSDDKPSIANQKDKPSEELTGSLIENIAIDFENPDYYIPDPSAYIPSQPVPDENGYTDNPMEIGADFEVSDLIMQMLEGITDGSGAALLNFGDITTEVPVEAMRDALQYNGVNTNDILVDLKRESNDMSEPDSETPRLQAHSQMIQDLVEQTGSTVDDDTADKIRDAIDEKGLVDWSEADDAEIIKAIAEVAGPGILGREVQEDTTPTPSPVSPPQSGDRQPYKPEEVIIEGEQSQPIEAPIDSPENVTPQFVYPGPREAGYTANNTVLDSNGAAVGAGARVQALSDGRAGTVIAVQNIDTKSGRDADYVRVRFDDGKVAVRSARQIFGIDAGAPIAQGEGPGQLPPARRNPIPQDPTQRFNEPAPAGTPVIAGDGSIPGVKLVDVPDDIAELTNPDAKQADFAVWGLRAPEIARAGRERASLEKIVDLIEKQKEAKDIANSSTSSAEERDKAKNDAEALTVQIERIVRDTFGVREGVTFGKNNYTIKDRARVTFQKYVNGEIEVSIGFAILNDQGEPIGEGSRTLTGRDVANPDGTTARVWTVKNNILKIPNSRDKKSGFVTAYNRYMEDWYIANGVSSVKVYAAGGGGWQGGYVWAVNGFNWDKNQASTVPRILRSMLMKRDITDEEKAIINRMQERIAKDNPTGDYTPDTVPTPLEIALIGWYPGATNWIGKKQMISMSWYGEKRLDPQAIEQRQAINYDQSRKARKRVEDKVNKAGVSRDLVLKMNSNEFADANPELAPYLDQIRDVLRSNRSLAVLSPAAKTALNRFTASQLLKGEDRTVALQDIFKLRTALDAEFKADNPLVGSKDFGVGNQLLDVSIDDVSANRVPGFTVKRLGMYESGVNETFMLTHNDSGQIFFVKKDSYAAVYQINGAGAEVQADAMLRASGVAAGYEARVSNVDEEIIVMQRAGAGIPLLGEPMTASNAVGNKLSINLPDGTTVKVTAQNFMDLLHTPEDAVRVMLVDLIISNMDRHNGNLLLAVDGTDTGKIRLLPIDHALSSFSPDTEGMQYTVRELFDNSFDNLYGMAMPVLTKRLKQEELLDLFKNEARAMMQELNNPANLPTGKELDLIIKNFGSLDAYRQKIQERIDSLLTPGNEGYQTFLSVLKPSHWSTR